MKDYILDYIYILSMGTKTLTDLEDPSFRLYSEFKKSWTYQRFLMFLENKEKEANKEIVLKNLWVLNNYLNEFIKTDSGLYMNGKCEGLIINAFSSKSYAKRFVDNYKKQKEYV